MIERGTGTHLEVLAEGGLIVAAAESDLKDAALRSERSEPRKALLTAAAHARKQAVALRQRDGAQHPHNVLQRVFEEDQVQRLVLGVVQLHEALHQRFDVPIATQVLIHLHLRISADTSRSQLLTATCYQRQHPD